MFKSYKSLKVEFAKINENNIRICYIIILSLQFPEQFPEFVQRTEPKIKAKKPNILY